MCGLGLEGGGIGLEGGGIGVADLEDGDMGLTLQDESSFSKRCKCFTSGFWCESDVRGVHRESFLSL